MDYYAYDYCYPYFHQDWRLFTPCPHKNFTILVKYEVNGQEHICLPLYETLHEMNLLSGKEINMLSLTNASGYAGHQGDSIKGNLYHFSKNSNFTIFKTAVISYVKAKHKEEISNPRITLILDDFTDYSRKILIE